MAPLVPSARTEGRTSLRPATRKIELIDSYRARSGTPPARSHELSRVSAQFQPSFNNKML